MKIGQYCQRQRCRHVELEQFWQAFASRGFVSDSWAFLFLLPTCCWSCNYCMMLLVCMIILTNLLNVIKSVIDWCWNAWWTLQGRSCLSGEFQRIWRTKIWLNSSRRTTLVWRLSIWQMANRKLLVNLLLLTTFASIFYVRFMVYCNFAWTVCESCRWNVILSVMVNLQCVVLDICAIVLVYRSTLCVHPGLIVYVA